jgi:hypothetical protein
MIDSDKQALVDALNEFGVIHERKVTAEMARVYWKYLSHLPRDGFDYAVRYIHEHERFFPTPSAFVKAEKARWT